MAIEALLMVVFFISCLYVRSMFRENSSSKLYWKKNKRNTAILSLCEELKAGYQPTFWASNPHIQTLMGFFTYFFNHRFKFRTEYIQMRDGGTIAIEWYTDCEFSHDKKALSNTDPILLISTWALGPDVTSLCEISYKEGYQPVIYNCRGHNVPLTTRQFAAFLDADDFKEAVDYIHNVHPFSDLFALGYSLGAAPIIGYLGKRGKSSLINAAVLISSTLDIDLLLTSGFKSPYRGIINQFFKQLVKAYTCLHKLDSDAEAEHAKSLHDVLSMSHWEENPYESFNDWLKLNNPNSFVRNIRTPTLFVNSLDDPVIEDKCPAYVSLRNNSYCLEVVTETGGHCGFFDGIRASPWTDRIALEFYNAVFNCRSLIISPVKNGFTRLRSVTR